MQKLKNYDFSKDYRKLGKILIIWEKLKKIKPQLTILGLGK
jgi:hypothetical protein